MTTDWRQRWSAPMSGPNATELWSVPLPSTGGGLLTVDPSGGCVLSVSDAVVAYDGDGRHRWSVPAGQRVLGGGSVVTPDGELVRMESRSVVGRRLDTGEVVYSFPALRASGLSVAPWGDLLYSQAAPQGIAAVHCVTRTGDVRWSAPLDGPAPLICEPVAVGDLMVIERRGALWAYDRDGGVPWIADLDGVRQPRPEDDAPRSTGQPGPAVHMVDAVRLDENRAVVELGSYAARGIYLIDGVAATLTPVAVPSPALSPFAVGLWPATEYRIYGLGAQVHLGQQRREHPVTAIEPGGAVVWDHGLPYRAVALAAAPGGHVLASASPDERRWNDYSKWLDLSRETFVRLIDPDGAERWTWHPPGRITHAPAASPDGIVYVGADERLWAFAV